MRFFNRLHVVLLDSSSDEERLYLIREIQAALMAGYHLDDDELRLWNQLGFRSGGI